jgi:ribosomal protein S18 acetylase RimI-like enzyme
MIRPMLLSDVEHLLPITRRCGAFSLEEQALAFEVMQLGLSTDAYPHLVLERGGSVIGYICVGPIAATRSSWHLYWIAVSPEAQGLGSGRNLLAAGEALVTERGGARLVLETSGRPDYARTRRFYEEAGYLEVGRVKDYYQPGDDCVTYCRSLA